MKNKEDILKNKKILQKNGHSKRSRKKNLLRGRPESGLKNRLVPMLSL